MVKFILHILIKRIIHLLQTKNMAQHKLIYILSFRMLICLTVILGYLKLSDKISWRGLLHVEWFDLAQAQLVLYSDQTYYEYDWVITYACLIVGLLVYFWAEADIFHHGWLAKIGGILLIFDEECALFAQAHCFQALKVYGIFELVIKV